MIPTFNIEGYCQACGEAEQTHRYSDIYVCEDCFEGLQECQDDIDHWGDNDKSEDELAGERFQDKLDAYRNEY